MTAMLMKCALGISLAAAATGCNADAEVCAPIELPEAPAPAASADDVAPIFERSCALGGCHLRAPGAGGLVLGRSPETWRAALVNVPSVQHREMPLVAPGDPDRSWLVVKIFGAACEACEPSAGCGGPMPPGDPLSESERATIIAWIADGAR
jgi:hypothetical protein